MHIITTLHTLITPTAYLGPVQLYAHIYAADRIVEDRGEHFIKQTYRNRCCIASPTGPLALTVPIVRDNATHTPVRDIRLSDHGNWRHQHFTALVSAYENSPYFFYYADDFAAIYEKPFTFLADFNEAFHETVLQLLALDRPVEHAAAYVDAAAFNAASTTDLRPLLSPKQPLTADPSFAPAPYWQIFQQHTGFLPNLSIVDLLSSMGPESRMVLKRSLHAPF